jgi:hypothetical protein
MNITDLIGGGIGSVVSSTVAKTLGIEESKAKWIVSAAVPLMIAALNYNAKNKGQAANIDNALDQHSGGGLLDNLSGLFSGGVADDGNKIVGHIFGNNTGYVTDNLSQKTGLSSGQIGSVLSVLAPVVMGYLGQQKQAQSSGGGLGDLIGGLLGGGQQGGGAGDLIGGLLGGGQQSGGAGDLIGGLLGNVLGGGQQQQESPSAGGGLGMLADLAGEFFKQKSNPAQGGNVLDSLAGLFGK